MLRALTFMRHFGFHFIKLVDYVGILENRELCSLKSLFISGSNLEKYKK